MMWKDSYKLGVEHIDKQHKELFDKTEELLRLAKSEDSTERKKLCMETILFLKDYSVKHFTAEEEYQQSINYVDYEEHKAIHKSFIDSVLMSEKKLMDSDFSINAIRDFSGFLTAWLIYHVADADQKIKTGKKIACPNTAIRDFYVTCFAHSMGTVLETMLGKVPRGILFTEEYNNDADDVVIQIEIDGAFSGNAFFIFPSKTVFGLTKAMTFMEMTEANEIAYSLLAEISNIVCGNAATQISESGRKCDITYPQVLLDIGIVNFKNGFHMNTEHGKIAAYINI